jgi:hypothetical protein
VIYFTAVILQIPKFIPQEVAACRRRTRKFILKVCGSIARP